MVITHLRAVCSSVSSHSYEYLDPAPRASPYVLESAPSRPLWTIRHVEKFVGPVEESRYRSFVKCRTVGSLTASCQDVLLPPVPSPFRCSSSLAFVESSACSQSLQRFVPKGRRTRQGKDDEPGHVCTVCFLMSSHLLSLGLRV